VVAEQVLPAARTIADATSYATRAGAAALSLRAAGVDRLVVLDAGIATVTFMRQADSVGFRPRYALNSAMGPAWLASVAPAAQLKGAEGVGFAPLLDVAAGAEPAPNDTRRRCESIYRDAKVAIGARTPAGQFAALSLCDDVLALRDAIQTAGDTDTAAWARAFERIGSRRGSAVALSVKLGGARHDGAATVRRIRFDESCGCTRYAGDPEAVP
jgi:ABC-type branched-subunit amino acid transport system substrate-binding protein